MTEPNWHHIERQLRTLTRIWDRPAEPRRITDNQSLQLSASRGMIAGYALRETSGTNLALIKLRDGADNSADLLMPIALSPAESARDWFMPNGPGFEQGLYLDIASGTVEGVIYVVPRPGGEP